MLPFPWSLLLSQSMESVVVVVVCVFVVGSLLSLLLVALIYHPWLTGR